MKKYLPTIIVAVIIVAVIGFVVWAASSSKNDSSPTESTKSEDSVVANDEQKKQLAQGWNQGNASAKVVLTEFGDFQCPACAKINPLIKDQLLPKYQEKVLFVFKNFPLDMHKNSWPAAQAAEAAGAQNKYWQMHDMLYEKQEEWAELANPNDKFVAYAREIGLDENKFKSDIEAKRYKDRIQADVDLGTALQLPGTPSFYVNGQPVNLQSGIKDIEAALDQAASK